ncbi:MAG: choice-of-anchor D domain-containing protein [Myxococcota bacterium]
MLRFPWSARAALALSILVSVASGCGCGDRAGVQRNLGEVGVVWRDAQGERVISRDAIYDFGAALVGEKKTLTMTVRNVGVGKLSLLTLERTEGAEVAIGGPGTATSSFEVEFRPVDLEPSGQMEYAIAFTPKSLDGAFEAKLRLTTEGGRPEDSIAVITLRGSAQRGACDFPTVLDFGKVPVGDSLPLTLPFPNPTSLDATGFVGELTGADAASFGFAANSPRGEVAVAAMGSTDVTFTFSPTEKRQYEAQVVVRGAGGCPDVTITIRGEGADEVLTWTPNELVYGHVPPGTEKLLQVTFTNVSNVPITLTDVTSQSPGDFYVVPAPGGDPTRLVVPGGGTATALTIACNPSQLGRRDSTLSFKTPLTRIAMGAIALKCTGGGPKIRVTPTPTLAFGRVGYFQGATNYSVGRKVTVQNVGTPPPMPDLTANLFLGQVASDGTPGQLPLFEVTPKNADTAADEFAVGLGSAYDSSRGLEAVAGRNLVDLAVTLTPKSVGLKEAELVIYSNDPSQPEVRVTLTANVQQLPPCNFRVSPATADFGLVTPPTTKDLPIVITNLGIQPSEVCYLSGIDIAAGSAPAYSIVGGPIVEHELLPQASFTVVVRVAPPGPVPTTLTSLLGQLAFNVSSPTTPRVAVPLTTRVGPACLAITPDPMDFGTVKRGCNSPSRTLNIYNVCNTTMTITGFSVPAAGGQPAGGPNCSGTNPCPEFFLVSAPTIPMGGLALPPGQAPLQVQLKYAPIDLGTDTGALGIDAVQNGQSLSYLVGLAGQGDTLGRQTDTFQQSNQPKADILLVIDDSCSMSDKQMSLASNFASFIQYATATNTDWQIGVITTTEDVVPCPIPSLCPGVPGGGILVKKGNIGPILTPSTPNVSSAFASLVNVGTDGSGSETGLSTAVLALTPPRIAAENAGFLRTDANLAVVVISDAGDQSVQPVSYYQNRLVNVKGFNRLSMFTFSAIVPQAMIPPGNCSYDDTSGTPRYLNVVAYTSGVSDEICSSNWASTLQNLGRTAFGFRTQFYLNNVPDLSMGQVIDVAINGVAVPTSSWTYDSASNSIIFDPAATPGPGQTLTVGYNTVCF